MGDLIDKMARDHACMVWCGLSNYAFAGYKGFRMFIVLSEATKEKRSDRSRKMRTLLRSGTKQALILVPEGAEIVATA